MKRSEVNRNIKLAKDILSKYSLHLPEFAFMSPGEWLNTGTGCDRIIKNRLGWDVSDFGGNDFESFGAVMYTLRNGNYSNPKNGTPYAEKYIVLKPGQRLPMHFHFQKTEDIINRGGGILSIEIFNSTDNNSIDKTSQVTVFCDGCEKKVDAGKVLDIEPGNSITITPRLYHRFWAKAQGGTLVCGEVSTVNDDMTDNYFGEPGNRFSDIEEDEFPLHLLCNEYVGFFDRIRKN